MKVIAEYRDTEHGKEVTGLDPDTAQTLALALAQRDEFEIVRSVRVEAEDEAGEEE